MKTRHRRGKKNAKHDEAVQALNEAEEFDDDEPLIKGELE